MMRWRTDQQFDPKQWHSWFAWHPVKTDECWAWLETVERRWENYGPAYDDGYRWAYRIAEVMHKC